MTSQASGTVAHQDPPARRLAQAIELHRAGKLADAEAIYTEILAAEPDRADALQFLGVLRYRQGASAEAAALLGRALTILEGNTASAYNNLGNVLVEMRRVEEAVAFYQRALALRPEDPDPNGNLSIALRMLDRLDEAEAAIEKAIVFGPANPIFRYSLGLLRLQQHQPEAAIAALQAALQLNPDFAVARPALLRAMRRAGSPLEAALEVINEWLAREPENPFALHMRAAYSGREIPARAPDTYVRALFGPFAESFDSHLAGLDYRAPQLLLSAISGFIGEPKATLDVLDAGCGTGLCGPLLRPFAKSLIGVGLVETMLAKARERGVYDELVAGELTQFLAARHAAYDLILSADALVYFGDLAEAARAAGGALRAGGILAFTLERRDDDEPDYRLEEHGRYSHTANYVRRIAAEAGLAIAALDHAVPRNEGGVPVAGLVVVAHKPAQ
jgi:predicted TPR repeat methyltransferase